MARNSRGGWRRGKRLPTKERETDAGPRRTPAGSRLVIAAQHGRVADPRSSGPGGVAGGRGPRSDRRGDHLSPERAGGSPVRSGAGVAGPHLRISDAAAEFAADGASVPGRPADDVAGAGVAAAPYGVGGVSGAARRPDSALDGAGGHGVYGGGLGGLAARGRGRVEDPGQRLQTQSHVVRADEGPGATVGSGDCGARGDPRGARCGRPAGAAGSARPAPPAPHAGPSGDAGPGSGGGGGTRGGVARCPAEHDSPRGAARGRSRRRAPVRGPPQPPIPSRPRPCRPTRPSTISRTPSPPL